MMKMMTFSILSNRGICCSEERKCGKNQYCLTHKCGLLLFVNIYCLAKQRHQLLSKAKSWTMVLDFDNKIHIWDQFCDDEKSKYLDAILICVKLIVYQKQTTVLKTRFWLNINFTGLLIGFDILFLLLLYHFFAYKIQINISQYNLLEYWHNGDYSSLSSISSFLHDDSIGYAQLLTW